MADKRITQGEETLAYLLNNGTITRLQAACELHIFELSSRIGELKRKGYNITSETIKAVNKNGRMTNFNIYKLEEKER